MPEPTIHIFDNDSEADTCRKEVLPKLYDSDWKDDQILEQQTFTDGKIIKSCSRHQKTIVNRKQTVM